jgi:[acyl-carrier-protein] S-malonyltransferase
MEKLAFVFPGQGSQYVGMGADCYRSDAAARELFDRADAVLASTLTSLCFTGPEDELRQTHNTQPAIFLHSMVIAALLKHLKPEMAAGHSLGEYSALVAAGALSFEDGLKLVRLRGTLMQQAGQQRKGTMAAVVGLSPEDVKEVCREAAVAGIVQPANFNSPGQIVISGSVAGVQRAMELARQRGGKLVKELVVSGAFHSPLMESAQEGLKDALSTTTLRDATIPVYANVTAEPVMKASEIRELLYLQLTQPVLWEQTVRNMHRDGATTFVELGPGQVLQGLIKRTASSVAVRGADTYSDVQELMR